MAGVLKTNEEFDRALLCQHVGVGLVVAITYKPSACQQDLNCDIELLQVC